jgi:hypothetical protein
MRWAQGAAAFVLAAGGLAAAPGCGVGSGYRVWWDQDKGAVTTYGSAPVVDASVRADASSNEGGKDAAEEIVEAAPALPPIGSVILVLMSSQPWSAIAGSASAPYVNGTLLVRGAHSEAYHAGDPALVAGEPNILWLEGGQDFGLTTNSPPTSNHTKSTAHLVDQLEAAGVTWKAYVEGISGGSCPLVDAYPYRAFHVPFLFFEDVVGYPASLSAKRCVEHVVPYGQLAKDLAAHALPRYAFVVPDLCDDMHDDCKTGGPVAQGDTWLSSAIPPLLASQEYAGGAAVLVVWEFANTGDVPIGLIALSAKVRAGYAAKTTVDASATVRTLQEVFGVSPPLGGAATAPDLAELFESFP